MDAATAAVITAAGTFGGVVLTAGVSYATLRRRFSGDIRTVEATALWKDNANLRETLMVQNARLDERVQELELTARELRQNLESARHERDELLHRLARLEAEGQHKDGEIKRLKEQLAAQSARVAELEEELRLRMVAAKTATERSIKLSGQSTPTALGD